jgi:hypothetical protein
MAIIYDNDGSRIGEVGSGGTVTDGSDSIVGRVGSAGGGEVEDLSQRVGDVSRGGEVTNLRGDQVGSISGTTVYRADGSRVGSVSAETATYYVTGITEAHKAGAALLLLLLKQGDRQDLPAYETGTSVPTAPTTPPLSGEDSPYGTRREDSYRPENAVAAAKKPWMKISIGSLLVLALLGAGSYTIYSVTHSGSSATQALSASRLSLPGISVDPPNGWTNFPVSGPGNLAMAPPGTGSCPNTPYGGPARCLDAVSISRNLSTLPSGDDPKEALELLANERFDALRASIRSTVVLTRKALTVDGCPSYLTEWRVSWLEPPDTIEIWITVRTNVVSQNTYLASIFIRLASQRTNSSRALMNAIASSVRCNS